MATTPGSRLGPYEIIARIGAGGMGEVFRARDTRLDRSVAIKVLPAEFAKNAHLKLRFEREARAISQLNHPHICTLYDVGDDYLVMELLEGETLAERLTRGALPLADVLRLGAQIADALDRAHRAGIVHRDLKPGNIMLTKSGAKLLDFGLAKSSLHEVNPDGETVHHEKALTQEGTILGTFQYMAPEQLEAEEADPRTDIFALGAVLYEMATGKRAFEGKTKTSLIASIVAAQPKPVAEIMPLSPPAIDHVIQKCLEKEREDRWQSAHDVAEELKWIASVPAVGQKVESTRRFKAATAAAIVLALALAGVTAMWLRARSTPRPRTAFAILPPHGLAFGAHYIAPDGESIAFTARDAKEGGIFVRQVDRIAMKRLTSGIDDQILAWSPNSKWLLYLSDGQTGRQMMKIAAEGGTPELVSKQVPLANGGTDWSPDGTIVYNRVFGEGLMKVRLDGAPPETVTTLDAKRRETVHGYPRFLSDGKRFLYVVHTFAEQKNEIWAGSVDGSVKKLIVRADSLVGATRSHLYFVNEGAIYAQPFDQADLALSGEARRVVDNVAFSEGNITAGATVSGEGALLYNPIQTRRREFGWYDRGGRRIEKLLDLVDMIPRDLSRDGTKLAAIKMEHAKGAHDVYVIDLVRGIQTRLTGGLSNNVSPFWSPAGDKIYFLSDRDGLYDIYVQAEDGTTPPVAVWKGERDKALEAVSPSGDALLATWFDPARDEDIWLIPVNDPSKRRLIVSTDRRDYAAEFSPDGRWISYISDRSGRDEVYVRPIDGGRTTQISTNGTAGHAWITSSELVLRTLDHDRVAIPLTFQGDTVIPGKPVHLFAMPTRAGGIVAIREKGFALWTMPDPSDYISAIHYDSGAID